jgi:chromosome segregation ATPase
MALDEHNSYSYAFTADPNKPLREAKETIVSLTGDVEMLNGIIKGLRQMVADAQSSRAQLEKDFNLALQELHQHNELLKKVIDGATRLRAERDDARQESCVLLSTIQDLEAAIPLGTVVNSISDTPTNLAKKRGWDCFQDRGMDCLKGDGK